MFRDPVLPRKLLDISKLNLDSHGPSFQGREPLPLRRVTSVTDLKIPDCIDDTELRVWILGECSVILTRDFGCEWHLSIAHPVRYPSWDEIAEARYRILPPWITMVMVLPPLDDYVNVHRNCFQLHQVPNRNDSRPAPQEGHVLRNEFSSGGKWVFPQ